VELYEKPQSILSIHFPWVRYDSWFGMAKPPVTPKYIKESVRNALNEGWQPDRSEIFKITHEATETNKWFLKE